MWFSELYDAAKGVKNKTAGTTQHLEEIERNVKRADKTLIELRGQMADLLRSSEELKENATRLQEANVEGTGYPNLLYVFS